MAAPLRPTPQPDLLRQGLLHPGLPHALADTGNICVPHVNGPPVRSMHEVLNAIACEGCDALYSQPGLRRSEIARCPRCGTELDRHPGRQHERILPLTIASLVLFAIANVFPIVEIQLRGISSQTTLLGAVIALTGEGRALVAVIVLATTILFPLLQLTVLFYLLFPARDQGQPAGFDWLVRSIQSLRPWGMIEVFLLGILVAIVKLSSMAIIVPGAALWAYIALTVLLTAVLSFDPRTLWDDRVHRQAATRQ